MSCKRILAAALSFAAAAFVFTEKAAAVPTVSARSAILLDATTGAVLYEKDADSRALIASTTKIMTGLLICECCALSETVTVPQEAVGIEGSSMYLKAGECLSVEELLYGLLLQSGNDAAVALAIVCDGSVARFVQRMNARAEALGLQNTHFSNPNGLDSEENYSTARDLAYLSRAAMQNENFCRIAATKTTHAGSRVLSNHNKLLWRYSGAIGVKTGYTKAAGRILVGAAERNGRRLISVTIHAPDDWTDHIRLLDFGFSGLTERTLVRAGDCVGTVPVLSGEAKTARLFAREPVSYYARAEETLSLRLLVPEFVFAPVAAGAYAADAAILLNGTEVGRIPLYWGEDVAECA